ncbi:hypothetical protein IQ244_29320 [Nostoc sp. LEGE 06077]|uniref:hypothetical protein n=1 Tax=Nostoc sp. LEGE 06077 TaxID=915325 RepID=UPI00188216E6|nr:hypothetical protein [Nostoc sp. LEGE 06077]MBE9210531.1 hypothetical protein [Nostoc sp. LEGE 06077]
MQPIKQAILMTLLASQISLINFPVKAQTSDPNAVVVDTGESDVDVPNPVKKIEKTFLEKTLDLYIKGQEYLTTARKYIDLDVKKFSIKWENINTEIGKAVDKAIKDGQKDPYKTGDGVKDAVSDQEDPDLIDTPPEVQGENAEIDVHQAYTRAQSQAVLGIDGQKNQAEEAEISNTAVTDSLEQAETAQKDVITQDILKKMAIQNLQTAMLARATHGESQRQTQLLATSNMNLADISGQMSVEEKKKQAESTAASREMLRAGAALDAFWKNQ